MWYTFWFEIVGEDSDLCGEEFFTELKTADKAEHVKYAQSIFPGEEIKCYGKVSAAYAEMVGLDTY